MLIDLLFSPDNVILCLIYIIACWGSFMAVMSGAIPGGNAGIAAIGAYFSGICTAKLGLPFGVGILVAVVASSIVGLIFTLPGARVGRFSFLYCTLAMQVIIQVIFKNVEYTGSTEGFLGIPHYTNTTLVWISAVVIGLFVWLLERSRFGKACRAAGSDPIAARAQGIPVVHMRMAAFAVSGAIAGYSGVLHIHWIMYTNPLIWHLVVSLWWCIAVFMGGSATVWGPLLGGFLVYYVPTFFRTIHATMMWGDVLSAAIFFVIIRGVPQGLISREFTQRISAAIVRGLRVIVPAPARASTRGGS